MKLLNFFALNVSLLTSLFVVQATQAGGTTATEDLIARLQDMQALAGTFTQTQTDSEGELLSEASGEFTMSRPGNLHWKTTAPYEQLLVSNGESLWLYDPDLEQVTVSPVGDQLQDSPAIIFSDDLSRIESGYRVAVNGNGSYRLLPRAQDTGFQRLDLFFNDSSLSAMELFDSFGQRTLFSFDQIQLNPQLSDELFQFTAPEGTDVLVNE